ncbi:MAG: glycosyltransferase [Clostridia bacterium]
MKIAILTMFNGLSNTYSLVNVVSEQLKMLLADNVSVKMLVSEHCPDFERVGVFADSRIEWIKIVNSINGKQFNWKTYNKVDDEIEDKIYQEADIIAIDLIFALRDVDICFMHDILYQGVHLVHNLAVRKAQKQLPFVKFVAFTHSAPVIMKNASYPISCMFSAMPNTTFIYPTKCGLPALARQYNCDIDSCYSINNSIDILQGMTEEVVNISHHIKFYEKEILIVYAGRMNMAKRFHVIAEFAGFIKVYAHKSVGIVFCDFASSDIDSEMYKRIIISQGEKAGLSKDDIVFTSDCGYKYGVKRETVYNLFSLSNLYICPSYSESFGLTVIEAISKGNFVVLNEAVPALKEIGDNIGAYFMRWSAKTYDGESYENYQPSEQAYYAENAIKIISLMDNNPVIKSKTLARMRYSNEWVYNNQMKPLIKKLTKTKNKYML